MLLAGLVHPLGRRPGPGQVAGLVVYRRRWAAVMTIAGVAPWYQGRILLPVLGKVTATRYTDRVQVRLVSGQSAADFASTRENLAHGFGAMLCRVRIGPVRAGGAGVRPPRRPGRHHPRPARSPAAPDLKALPVGRREDGLPWLVRLHGTHVLIAGATGAGKASLLWGLIRAMFPLLQAGPGPGAGRRPEADGTGLRPGHLRHLRPLRRRPGRHRRHARPGRRRHAGPGRPGSPDGSATTRPTAEHPFTVVLVDEVAFLTAYQPDRKLRERIMAALATLTTQGRAVGYCVVAALQDPRKDVLTIRNLFPDRIAMRLDEPEQVDMVLGDGARDRGAACELISSDPATGAGVAFVRLEADPDPVRVRAAWVTDADIRAMADACMPGRRGGGGGRMTAPTAGGPMSRARSAPPA